MDSEDRYRFKKQLKALKEMRGQGTELISIYIPPYYNPIEVTNKLREEAGQAMNIKSKQTRKSVTGAIERLLHSLKGFRAVPEHGIAFFCGNINDKIELYSLVPPEPLTLQTYRCDSTFFTEPLEALLEAKETYGLLVVDRREATIALLKGKSIKIVKHMHSQVPGKHRAGGQSSSRFESLIEIAAHAWFKKVGALANLTFSKQGVTVVLLGGPGPTKHSFLKGNFLTNEVKKKVEATIDTGYTDETGIKDLMHNAEGITEQLEITKEKKILNRFLKESSMDELATYGLKEVTLALENGQIETLIISEEVALHEYIYKCPGCGKLTYSVRKQDPGSSPCPKCKTPMKLNTVEDFVDKLLEKAKEYGTSIEFVSVETPEGKQFLEGFSGLGALLRFK